MLKSKFYYLILGTVFLVFGYIMEIIRVGFDVMTTYILAFTIPWIVFLIIYSFFSYVLGRYAKIHFILIVIIFIALNVGLVSLFSIVFPAELFMYSSIYAIFSGTGIGVLIMEYREHFTKEL